MFLTSSSISIPCHYSVTKLCSVFTGAQDKQYWCLYFIYVEMIWRFLLVLIQGLDEIFGIKTDYKWYNMLSQKLVFIMILKFLKALRLMYIGVDSRSQRRDHN